MAVRTIPGLREQIIAHTLTELAARKQREESGSSLYNADICDWAENHFYIPFNSAPIKMPLHQKAVTRFFFTRRTNNHFPFQTIIYSAIKKSGKSTIAGMIARYFSETQSRYAEVFTIGNDLDQAKDRSYKEVVRSIELTPGYDFQKDRLPGRWVMHKLSMTCMLSGSKIKAIAVDAKGEAGGQQALTVWTELWGAENQDARRFWDEMTPIPTVPDSLRLVETYAGYDGESELLYSLYDAGLSGHQMTAGELAEIVCRPDIEGESYQDFVDCWHETNGDPDVLIPVWRNDNASLGMYWDSGLNARRMPWQHNFVGNGDFCEMCHRDTTRAEHEIGEPANIYYNGQEALLTPQAFRRLHLNEWVSAESAFVPMESWDACGKAECHESAPIQTLMGGDKHTKIVLGVDGAVTGDCFGIVAVERCPFDPQCVDVRALRKWDPAESGGSIDLSQPEDFLRTVCKANNIIQIAYDPFQTENTAQRLRKEGVAWVEPFSQMGERLKADSQLRDMIMSGRIHHSNQPELREHITNANSKMQKDEDSKLRIVKKASGKKIDLTVALSMAVARCLFLRLGRLG